MRQATVEAAVMRRSLRVLAVCLLFAALLPRWALAADRPVFSVIVMRHGVRSIGKPPAGYRFADWSPVLPNNLTAHGYRLLTFEGRFFATYLAAAGLPLSCSEPNAFFYADVDQRTLLSGAALIEGMCGSPTALPLHHSVDLTQPDPLFDASAWIKAHQQTSRREFAPQPTDVEPWDAYEPLQRFLDSKCIGTCAPLRSKTAKEQSTLGEDAFLEYAQCEPSQAFNVSGIDDARVISAALQVHVYSYLIGNRLTLVASKDQGTFLAHIVGLLDAHAHVHPAVETPDTMKQSVAFLVGHDSQLGALGGLLNLNWVQQKELVYDDMPPGSALVFELHEVDQRYLVRMRFVYQTFAQFRSARMLADGTQSLELGTLPLSQLEGAATALQGKGYVNPAWPVMNAAPFQVAPPVDPPWTACTP